MLGECGGPADFGFSIGQSGRFVGFGHDFRR